MSGICAILRLDGALAEAEFLAPVLAGLAARGPERSNICADGPAALGHALLATTPEAVIEPMPLRHAGSGCLITADVRLDNRADLTAVLGLDTQGRELGDGALILEAYLKWGMECPQHLLGDFAFVIWDPRSHRLFAARDKVGMRQLIYHFAPGKLIACSTDPDPLLGHQDVPRRINAARVADFLEQLEAIDHTSTFYEGLTRLPPAHALQVEGGNLKVWRYWQLTPSATMSRASADDNAQAFLDIFTDAVRARLRSPTPVGSMLSGGIDSGSVVAVAARLLQQMGAPPLATFSGVDDDPACKESACIRDAIATIPNIAPHIASLAEPDDFCAEVAHLTAIESDPFDGHMALIRAIYVTARKAGVKVMLDGVSGDTTLGTGNMIGFHLRRGRVLTAWAEARAQEEIWGAAEVRTTTAFAAAMRRVLVPARLSAIRRVRWERANTERAARVSIVEPAIAARVDMAARRQRFSQHVALGESCDPAINARRMLHPFAVVGRERYDRVAGALGIEPRDPFLDVRLLEFCLTLPPEQLHGNGWAKLILRQAMAGMLPESIRWKRGRDHVGWRFVAACLPGRLDDLSDAEISQLYRYARRGTNGGEATLQCSEGRVVSAADLLYLLSWLINSNAARS